MPLVTLHCDSAFAWLPEDLQGAAASGGVINVFRALLGSPEIVAHVIRLGAVQFATSVLKWR